MATLCAYELLKKRGGKLRPDQVNTGRPTASLGEQNSTVFDTRVSTRPLTLSILVQCTAAVIHRSSHSSLSSKPACQPAARALPPKQAPHGIPTRSPPLPPFSDPPPPAARVVGTAHGSGQGVRVWRAPRRQPRFCPGLCPHRPRHLVSAAPASHRGRGLRRFVIGASAQCLLPRRSTLRCPTRPSHKLPPPTPRPPQNPQTHKPPNTRPPNHC